VTRFHFVADHSDTYQVKRLCELERSSYYAWKAAEPAKAARAEAAAQLAERIRAIPTEDNTYGAPGSPPNFGDGVTVDERVNHKRVARVMRENDIVGYRRRRRVTTTVPEPADRKVPDLLERDFTADAPAGQSPTMCAPTSSPARSVPPPRCVMDWPWRCSQRPRKSIHVKGFRGYLRLSRRHPVDGQGRHEHRQQPRRNFQRRPRTRSPPERERLAG
jgi:hypothetical protein